MPHSDKRGRWVPAVPEVRAEALQVATERDWNTKPEAYPPELGFAFLYSQSQAAPAASEKWHWVIAPDAPTPSKRTLDLFTAPGNIVVHLPIGELFCIS